MRKTVVIAIIQNKKILLVKKGKIWCLPNEEPKENETDIQCLFRKMKEELPNMTIHSVIFLKEFWCFTPHTCTQMKSFVYLVDADGSIKPSAEISDSKWVDSFKFKGLKISEPTKKCISLLQKKGYL